jgi:hypothetical protein
VGVGLPPVTNGGYVFCMAHQATSSRPTSGFPRGRRGALVLGGLLRWLVLRSRRDRPDGFSLGSKSEPVLERANQLALDGRENDGAVSGLVVAANGNRRTLRRARHASRFCGLHHEHWHANRVYRLLDAACSGGPVAAVSSKDRRRIEQVEAMMALPPHQRWALLVGREPRLLRIESKVRSGTWGRLPTPTVGDRSRQGKPRSGPIGGRGTSRSHLASHTPTLKTNNCARRATARCGSTSAS